MRQTQCRRAGLSEPLLLTDVIRTKSHVLAQRVFLKKLINAEAVKWKPFVFSMDFPIHSDTISLGLPIVYCKFGNFREDFLSGIAFKDIIATVKICN